jgi:hypothetical protein
MIFSCGKEKFKTHLRLIYCGLTIMFIFHFEDNIQIS